jgi:hypothetical protein
MTFHLPSDPDRTEVERITDPVDRAIAQAGRLTQPNGPVWHTPVWYDRALKLRHWRWRVEDERTGVEYATGRAWTQGGAANAKHRAFVKALEVVHGGGAA